MRAESTDGNDPRNRPERKHSESPSPPDALRYEWHYLHRKHRQEKS
jgi:hypothetical protein